MDIETLLKRLPANYTALDREMVIRAYHMAEKAHEGQFRASGQPYITHCVGVALILADLEVDPPLLAAGLMHDVVEDTTITLETIKSEFGETVSKFVDGVTKLTNLPNVSRADQHEDEQIPLESQSTSAATSRKAALVAETLRKTFLAMGEDVRVVLIKLADRLHNMRTLNFLPESRQKKIAQETLEIFAPLANRLGIWQIKWELEDLGFRYTNSTKFKEIAENIASTREKREEDVKKITKKLKDILEDADIPAKITGRPKHIYSIYQKMLRKDLSFEMVRDLRGVRIIVDDNESCYKVLGIIHMNWRPIPGEFDDYIASKKPNNYQSLHTSVIYDDGKPLEVQIRTEEMHRNAEQGIAAHWRYKEKSSLISEDYEQKISLVRSLIGWQDVEDPQEYLDGMKSDVFRDRVYILTPKGDIVDLPTGATPIDFAYQVHTNVGHRCRGAKVNGKLVTLDYVLKTGDQIEILTTKKGGPSRDWLNVNLGLVKTNRARSKIKQWFKLQDREMNLAQGKLVLEKEFKRLGIKQVDYEILASEFNAKTVEDFFVGVGCGDMPTGRVINKIAELEKENLQEDFDFIPLEPAKSTSTDAIIVMGLKGIATNIARCCNPMPGDQIIGYITRGRGATIHRSDCPNILRVTEKERLIEVVWGIAEETFPVAIQVKAYDRQGLMSDISLIISNEGLRLSDLNLKSNQNLVSINLVVDVRGIEQLSRLLTRLENLPNILEARRSRPG